MVKNKTLPDSAAHPGLVSLFLSLSHSPTPFILRVPLDPAGARTLAWRCQLQPKEGRG